VSKVITELRRYVIGWLGYIGIGHTDGELLVLVFGCDDACDCFIGNNGNSRAPGVVIWSNSVPTHPG